MNHRKSLHVNSTTEEDITHALLSSEAETGRGNRAYTVPPRLPDEAYDTQSDKLSEAEAAGLDDIKDAKGFTFFQVGRDFESSRVSHKFTNDELRRMGKYEGLDYYRDENIIYKEHVELTRDESSGPKWVMFFSIGLCVGASAFLMFETIAFILDKRYSTTLDMIKESKGGSYFEAYLFFVVSGAALAGLGSALVVYIAPAAAGSGVPDVMGYLNGVLIPHIFNIKTFVVKFLSCILAVGSGLPVGPEGPIIHMGAWVGASLPSARSHTLGWSLDSVLQRAGWKKYADLFRQPREHRDFITGGAGAGVSAAFSAPVGGLLFVFEEVASFWEPRLTWMVFFACLTASFSNALFQSYLDGWKVSGSFGYFASELDVLFPLITNKRFHVFSLGPTLLIGGLGGVLGAAFTFLNLKVVRLRINKTANMRLVKVLEVVTVCVLYSTVVFVMAVAGDCKDVPESMYCDLEEAGQGSHQSLNANVTPADSCKWLVHHTCAQRADLPEPNRYSPMATLCFTSGDKVVEHLFTTAEIGIETEAPDLLAFLAVYFLSSCWCAGMSISSGLVIPMLITGALMGRLVGRIFEYFITAHWIDTAIFALVGSSAFFAGVSRLTISLAVIMLEISGGVHFLLPIMAAVLVAKWIADFATHSLYHALLEVKCVPFLDFLCDIPKMDCFSAADIMQSPVSTISLRCTMQQVVATLEGTDHNGFPVVVKDPTSGRTVFKGMVLRTQLAGLVKLTVTHGSATGLVSSEASLPRAQGAEDAVPMSPGGPGSEVTSPVAYGTLHQCMDDIKHNREGVPEVHDEHLGTVLDLSAFINTSSFTVNQGFAINIVRDLFRTMALRHLPVVDDYNQVVGMITRKDLIGQAIEQGMEQRASGAQLAEDTVQLQLVD